MTLQELSQLYHLNREIEMDQRRLDVLEAKVFPGAQAMSGTSCGSADLRRLELYAAEIADLRGIIAEKQKDCILERNRLERYIAAIPDSLTRQIFTYRFINGLPWSQVAACVGGNNSDKSVRMLCYRYLKEH